MSQRLSIMHVSTAADRTAGAERLLEGIARRADPDKWDLRFIFVQPEGAFSRSLARLGFAVHSLDVEGVVSGARAVHRLQRMVLEARPDVVHAHLFHGGLLAAAACLPLRAARRVKLIQTRHYSDYHALFASRGRYAADRWAARRSDGIIAVSEAASAQLVGAERVPPERVVVIENGVDCDAIDALDPDAGRAQLLACGVPLASGARVVACAATFREQKGHRHLIDAFARVRDAIPDAHLVLLGTGPLEADVRARAAAAGLNKFTHFLGHREDAQAIMLAADLYVQPSVEEGFGLALVEAMAMRRAVVASAVGGMCRTVMDGETGLLVPPRNDAALAEALTMLLSDAQVRARMGDAGQKRARAHFSLDRMLSEYDRFYRTVVHA